MYRYDGSFSQDPVILREEVIQREGLRLTIDVRATRGSDELHWIQVVTDTPENRDNNVIDELYEVMDGARMRLPNEGNADLLRLYAWTLPACGPPAAPLPSETRALTIGTTPMNCTCERQRMQCDGVSSEMTSCDCPDLLWTHGFGEVLRAGEATPYWRMVVGEQARAARESAPRVAEPEPPPAATGPERPHLRNCVLHSGDARGRRGRDGVVTGRCSFDAECIAAPGGARDPADGFIRLRCENRACECTVERTGSGAEPAAFPFTAEEPCANAILARELFVEHCMVGSELAED